MTTLNDGELKALGDWWESDWPDTAAGVLGTLAETVEAILTARLAKVEALAEKGLTGWDLTPTVSGNEDPMWWYAYLRNVDEAWRSRIRAALASDPTHTQNGTQA